MKLISIYSDKEDIYTHLAFEEYLVNNYKEGSIILFFWRHLDTVVIGRNQNPWLEVNLGLLRRKKIKITRRLTGGGAVFHDWGNLNFSFIIPRKLYNYKLQMQGIQDLMQLLNIEVKIGASHALMYKDFKFSGNAFLYRHNLVLHHGTFLIESNLKLLKSILSNNYSNRIENNRSIESNCSEVINLSSVNEKADFYFILESMPIIFSKLFFAHLEIFKEFNIKNYPDYFFLSGGEIKDSFNLKLENSIKNYQCNDWIFNKTAYFEIKIPIMKYQQELFMAISYGKVKEVKLKVLNNGITSILWGNNNEEKILKEIFENEFFLYENMSKIIKNYMNKVQRHIYLRDVLSELREFFQNFL